MNVRDLERRRRKELVAAIPSRGGEFGERRRQHVHRVARQVRIGDMPLHAAHGQSSRQRAAPAVLDRVAEPLDRGRFADDAVVDRFAARAQGLDDPRGAVAWRVPPRRTSAAARSSRGWFGCARTNSSAATTKAAIELFMSEAPRPKSSAVAHRRCERVRVPLVQRARSARRRCGRQRRTPERRGRAAARGSSRRCRRSSRRRSPTAARRAASSDWQPPSSGVTDRRAIRSWTSSRVAALACAPCSHAATQRCSVRSARDCSGAPIAPR